jgi:hypothetical protein
MSWFGVVVCNSKDPLSSDSPELDVRLDVEASGSGVTASKAISHP